MRNILITTFVTFLMVGTAIIGSGHVVLAHNDKYTRDFTNTGNNQEIQQDCGNSCTQTSSNTVSSGSSGLTSPSPTPSTLTLLLNPIGPTVVQFSGRLTAAGSGVAGATITFTASRIGDGTFPLNLGSVVTDNNGDYGPILVNGSSIEVGTQVTAHFAGLPATPGFAASNSASQNVP